MARFSDTMNFPGIFLIDDKWREMLKWGSPNNPDYPEVPDPPDWTNIYVPEDLE